MARDISLTSQAWCDLIFEGKNQEYGAYAIRKQTNSRHLKALAIVTGLTVFSTLTFSFWEKNKPSDAGTDITIDTPYEISDLDNKKEEVVQPIIEIPTPQVEIRTSIAFVPPVIVPDEQATTTENPTQDELTLNRDAVIAGITAQGTTNPNAVIASDLIEVTNDNTGTPAGGIFEHVEQMPSYAGGQNELMAFLSKNIKYPVIAQEQGIEGTVVLRFVVEKDGAVSDVQVVRSLDPSCDKEAKRVINSMPNWIPGKQNGKAVRVYFTVPVRFRLAK